MDKKKLNLVLGGRKQQWYEINGIKPAVVYKPIGALSLENSYINLVTPGTYNAATGEAPTWDAVNGWKFNGTSQWLTTQYTWGANKTIIVRFTNCANASRELVFNGNSTMLIRPGAFDGRSYQNGATIKVNATAVTSGIMAIAGASGYYNGSADFTDMENNGQASVVTIAGNGFRWYAVYVQALAIYNAILTSDQVASLTTIMAALV